MELFRFLTFVFFIITSFVIILLLLFQDEQSDSIGGVFGGGSFSIFGSKSSNIAVRITAFFITLFFIFVVVLSFINTKRVDDNLLKDIKANEKTSTFWDDVEQDKDTVNEKTLDEEK
ncbi:preprotein translocase subunit SecG [Borrelia miyamotoi]|uniref:Protein-export membrane protein SecG n=1 Tax=Borrelia miyamotoi TaxID=47466 RepID=A0AAX3JNF4_9SPIR|nr:preprotein translocase subunit SecG [Borrelia miyamotoi]QFP42240.1 preprotein translocase subunit SecG [Borrelia miyamotoi]QFP48354.1 preprotein translocase subunit SecG [Borrelia miyamotoi]QGT56114.1 preprotein translocase subunit SecG [Borrelia miyamotoi]QGT56894.1 preprotein translocase subunit SecG [Borrelia miyamotoi]WAZ72160.1 preprotein translocase subunit SecG [Borrelia miyamotoi]